MTVGIVAAVEGYIVAVSDERLSYSDVFPATERGARKTLQIADNWHVTFAADDVTLFPAIIRKVIGSLKGKDLPPALVVMEAAQRAYAEALQEEFTARHLAPIGYRSVEQFRKEGYGELGKDLYGDYLTKLSRFDLGVEIIFFGYSEFKKPFIFRLVNPGKIVEDNVMGYSAVGSGSYMALASLRHKPLPPFLATVVYRALEAKFSSETASFVGGTTFVVVLSSDRRVRTMTAKDIEEVRAVWKEDLNRQVPEAASAVILKSGVGELTIIREPSALNSA